MASFGDLSRIRTNIGAFSALNTMNVINKALAKAQLQLATGKRINSAGDDPAGYSIAKEMEGKALRYGQALNNIGDGGNLLTTAESGITCIKDILIQMSVKTIQAASDTLATGDRDKIKVELEQLTAEINDIVAQTQWRDTKLLTAYNVTLWVGPEEVAADNAMGLTISAQPLTATAIGVDVKTVGAATVTFAPGATSSEITGLNVESVWSAYTELASDNYRIRVTRAAATVTVKMWDSNNNVVDIDADNTSVTTGLSTLMEITGLTPTEPVGVDLGRGFGFTVPATFVAGDSPHDMNTVYTRAGHSVSDASNAAAYLIDVKAALVLVDTELARVGAYEERLSIKEDCVASRETDVWAAYSRIMDADMAKTQLDVTKYTILQQSAVAGLAQANVAPSFILGLLGG